MRAGFLNRISEDLVISLCRDLIRFKTVNPPGDERICAEYVAKFLEKAGFSVEILVHTPERASVVARLKGSGELPGLLFSGHENDLDRSQWAFRITPTALGTRRRSGRNPACLPIPVLGGTNIFGGFGNLAGTILAVLIVTLMASGLQLGNINTIWQLAVLGFILLGAVALNQVILQRESKRLGISA